MKQLTSVDLFSLLIVTVWMNTFLGVWAVAALLVRAGVLVLVEPPLTHTKVLEMVLITNFVWACSSWPVEDHARCPAHMARHYGEEGPAAGLGEDCGPPAQGRCHQARGHVPGGIMMIILWCWTVLVMVTWQGWSPPQCCCPGRAQAPAPKGHSTPAWPSAPPCSSCPG